MKFSDYFSNNFETSDTHYIDSLRTHYYRNRIQEVKEMFNKIMIDEKGILKADDDQFNELFYEAPKYSCTATIIAVRPTEISVDFKITTYSVISFALGKKIIERLYKELDRTLQFKGIALYKG